MLFFSRYGLIISKKVEKKKIIQPKTSVFGDESDDEVCCNKLKNYFKFLLKAFFNF